MERGKLREIIFETVANYLLPFGILWNSFGTMQTLYGEPCIKIFLCNVFSRSKNSLYNFLYEIARTLLNGEKMETAENRATIVFLSQAQVGKKINKYTIAHIREKVVGCFCSRECTSYAGLWHASSICKINIHSSSPSPLQFRSRLN